MLTTTRWRRRALMLIGVIAAACLVAWIAVIARKKPSANRVWAADQARLAHAEFLGDNVVRVRDVRDFTYTADTTYTPAYYDRTFDLSRIETAWFILTPFSTSWRGPAHAFVSFGFGDSEYVAISVEARREAGEHYGLLSGALRRFEIAYIVGSERDLIGRRALYDGGDVYLYPINAPRERIREMFVEMLRRANALQAQPEFYNTFTNNCTSNLIDHVNRLIPGRIPFGLKTILPGYSDELAHKLGLIEGEGSLDAMRAKYRINERARSATGSVPFSRAIRQGMLTEG